MCDALESVVEIDKYLIERSRQTSITRLSSIVSVCSQRPRFSLISASISDRTTRYVDGSTNHRFIDVINFGQVGQCAGLCLDHVPVGAVHLVNYLDR